MELLGQVWVLMGSIYGMGMMADTLRVFNFLFALHWLGEYIYL